MKKLLFTCLALIVVPAAAFAQIDLTWDNCVTADVGNGEPAATTDKTFSCTSLKTYRLHGSFKTPVDIADFFAMDISIDLQQTPPGPLVQFYHYETGGCNATGMAFSVDKSTSGSLGDGNACVLFNTPWGDLGEQPAFAGVTAYGPDFGQPGRGRLLASIARASDNPFPLVANKNYYGFHFRLTTANRATCAGCGTPAAIVWNSATLYSNTMQPVTLSGRSLKSAQYCATVQNGVTTCAATPTRNTTWGQLKSIYR
jgi:hypothetical protein